MLADKKACEAADTGTDGRTDESSLGVSADNIAEKSTDGCAAGGTGERAFSLGTGTVITDIGAAAAAYSSYGHSHTDCNNVFVKIH
jgi:hypothetical protein